jgi:acyl-CoA hydrolase
MFIGPNVRPAVNEGRADYTPVFLSQVEDLFESGQMPIDVALIQVSPPDEHGFCSFGGAVREVRYRAGERPDAQNLRRLLHSHKGF